MAGVRRNSKSGNGSGKLDGGRRAARRGPRPLATQVTGERIAEALWTAGIELRGQADSHSCKPAEIRMQLLRKELETTRARVLRLYQLSPVGILVLDQNGVVEECNVRAAEMLRAAPEGVIGRPFLVMIHRSDWRLYLDHLVRAKNMGQTAVTQLGLARRDDDPLPVQLATVSAPSGRAGGLQFLATLTDLTAIRMLEAERVAAKEAERAAAMREETARQAALAKDRFLAVLSHELRTPLTPVVAALAILDEIPMDNDARHALEMIRRNVRIEAQLIDDLLDLTRVSKGKLRLRCQLVNLHETIDEIAGNVSSEVTAKGVSLATDLAATTPYVQGDALRLRQVIWNVVRNSVKFTSPGGSITIATRDGGEPGPAPMITVEVRDDGDGFEPEEGARIFQAFEQLEQDAARPSGLGLGLAIARGIVNAHGGHIHGASDGHGKGAVFTIELPAIEVGRATTVTDEPPAGDEVSKGFETEIPAARGQGHSLRILLVDDHDDSLNVLAFLLRRRGYEPIIAGTVAAALEVAARGDIDLVVSDIALPDGSGLDLMRALRARGVSRGIALSGFGAEEDLRRSREAGFGEHLVKPIDFSRLVEVIKRFADTLQPG